MSVAIRSATRSAISSWSSTTTVRIFSKPTEPLPSSKKPATGGPFAGLLLGAGACGARDRLVHGRRYALKELPQPQPPVEFGFLNVNPEPCMDET